MYRYSDCKIGFNYSRENRVLKLYVVIIVHIVIFMVLFPELKVLSDLIVSTLTVYNNNNNKCLLSRSPYLLDELCVHCHSKHKNSKT